MKRFLTSRLCLLFVLPNGLFLLGAALFGSEAMIGILNAAIVALAAGVCVAYFTTTRDIVLGRLPLNKVHWLALGIFLSWAGTQLGRWWSIVWRWLDQPMWLANSWIVAYGLFPGGLRRLFPPHRRRGDRRRARATATLDPLGCRRRRCRLYDGGGELRH